MRDNILIVFGGLLLCISGCVSMPRESLSALISATELSDHVHFLAQPALKGRKPFSLGSTIARDYIKRQFSALGLKPWGRARSYAQPFLLGTNVIGVLPGCDPHLSHETVILTAHYDHLGQTKQGLCLGACDNASGVAAMLEIAEAMALSETRPKRSIAFAALDREEDGLLGAFAFTCRKDFNDVKIAGAVNIDLLGRHGFGVLDNHVFLAGTEDYRELRRQILTAANDHIEILPVGTDIVGPRGDHVAFEAMDFPSLFFSCGLYEDYHQSTDTADKLDYTKMLYSTRFIKNTIVLLANNKNRFKPATPLEGDLEELSTLDICLTRLNDSPDIWNLTDKEVEHIHDLALQIDSIRRNRSYSPQERERLIHKVVLALSPMLELFESPKAAAKLQYLTGLELRSEIGDAGRTFIRQLPKQRARLLLPFPLFEYRKSIIPDKYLYLRKLETGQYQLAFAILRGTIKFKWPGLLLLPFSKNVFQISQGNSINIWVGSKQELIDICLIYWKRNRREYQNFDGAMLKVLSTLAGQNDPNSYEQWMAKRWDQGSWGDEKDWLLAMMRSDNIDLACAAIREAWKSLGRDCEPVVQNILSDKQSPVRIKRAALLTVDKEAGPRTLSILADMIDDETSWDRSIHPSKKLDENHPLFDLQVCKNEFLGQAFRELAKNQKSPATPIPGTIGEQALERLKKITKKDFGTDSCAWQTWIKRYW